MSILHSNALQLMVKELSRCLVDALPVEDSEFIGGILYKTKMGMVVHVLSDDEIEEIQQLHNKHVKGQND